MTKNDWILDVLADLKAFASSNGMASLSEQLDDTMLVAAGELVSLSEEAHAVINGKQSPAGSAASGIGRHQRA